MLTDKEIEKTDTTIGQKLLLRSLKKINLAKIQIWHKLNFRGIKNPYYHYIDTITNSLKRK